MKPILNFVSFVLITGIIVFVSCKKEKSCEDCATKNNKPPISIAGPDQTITLPTDSISLNGSRSNDPDGIISDPIAIGWLWTKISGPAFF